MANPQREDGHVDIANEIVEALAKTYLSSRESQVLWAIFRKTYGWHKKEDWITGNQLAKMTGIGKGHISETLKRLVQRKIVIKSGNKIGFQKDYEKWEKLPNWGTSKKFPKRVTNKVPQRGNSKFPNGVNKVPQRGNSKFPNGVNTKETITNNTTTNTTTTNIKGSNIHSADRTILCEQIIYYLNTEAGKNFLPSTPLTVKLINARLKEGFTLDDFKKVIDIKTEEWKGKYSKDGKNWEDYLRPQTLFGNKFEAYLNQDERDKRFDFLDKEEKTIE